MVIDCLEAKSFLVSRHIIFLFFLLLIFTKSEAQINLSGHENKKFYLGYMAGMNSSKFKITHSDSFIRHDSILVVESPPGIGFNFGIIGNLRLNKYFDLRSIVGMSIFPRYLEYQEVSILQKSLFIESVNVQLPLSLKFKSDRINNFRFYVLGGARAEYDFASNSKKRKASDIVKLKGFDLSAEYGIGFQFFLPMVILVPEIRFSNGFINIHTPTENFQYSDVLYGLKSQGIIFSLIVEG